VGGTIGGREKGALGWGRGREPEGGGRRGEGEREWGEGLRGDRKRGVSNGDERGEGAEGR